MGSTFNTKKFNKPNVFSKTNLRLHNQLDSYVSQNKKVAKAQEVELPVILGKEYFEQRESIHRPILTRLMRKIKHEGGNNLNLSLKDLQSESNIRRNRLVLEDVLCRREKQTWLDQTSSLVFDLHRQSKTQYQKSRFNQIIVAPN
jgi:hypothetical protein